MKKELTTPFSLVNEGGSLPEPPESSRNEQEARSGAECNSPASQNDGGLVQYVVDELGGVVVGRSPSPSPSPSFLVHNKLNVNARLRRIETLLKVWQFMDYKGRIGTTQVLLLHKNLYKTLRIMPASAHSRYFDDGRMNMSRRIMARLGKYRNIPGLMETLTYDPNKIEKQDAWARFSKDTRRFLNSINQYRKRRGWRRLHYLWVVEVQPDTGYPHVHIFFPNLKWLAPISILNSNWIHGRSNIASPKRIRTNCAGYISKYLRKMKGWGNIQLALLWSGKCRMYGFSRGFSAKWEKPESDWQMWAITHAKNVPAMEREFLKAGYCIDIKQ